MAHDNTSAILTGNEDAVMFPRACTRTDHCLNPVLVCVSFCFRNSFSFCAAWNYKLRGKESDPMLPFEDYRVLAPDTQTRLSLCYPVTRGPSRALRKIALHSGRMASSGGACTFEMKAVRVRTAVLDETVGILTQSCFQSSSPIMLILFFVIN